MTTRIVILLFVIIVLVSATVGDWAEPVDRTGQEILAREFARFLKLGVVVMNALTRAAIDSICALAENAAAAESRTYNAACVCISG